MDKHLDHDVLSALQEVMEEHYSELLETFLSDSEERLQMLRDADDVAQLISAAHSFKGSSSNMGAVRLARLCGKLEQLAKEKAPEGLAKLVGEIDGEFAVVRPLYEAEHERSLNIHSSNRCF